MGRTVNTRGKRSYDGTARQAAARETRRRIVRAARRLLIRKGYAAARVADIAAAAGVSTETVYASFGPKVKLVQHLLEVALSGEDEVVPALDRDWVLQVYAERSPERMVEMLASGVRQTEERIAPLWSVVKEAASHDSALAAIVKEMAGRRVTHMRAFIDDLISKGDLRPGLTAEAATDVLWAMNSPEFFTLFTRDRGWTSSQFEEWLADTWKLLLLPHS